MILLGRKGSGKTALARYLTQKYKNYGLDYVKKFRVNDFGGETKNKSKSMLVYVFILIVGELQNNNFLTEEGSNIFGDRLKQIGWLTSSYTAFIEDTKEESSRGSVDAGIKIPMAGINSNISSSDKVKYRRISINSSVPHIQSLLIQHLKKDKEIIIFLDDVADYLDNISPEKVTTEINYIRDFLHNIDSFNSKVRDEGKSLHLMICLRDDIFNNMTGSNINKLKNNLIDITRNEQSFYGLVKKRLPFLDGKSKEYIRDFFPSTGYDQMIDKFNTKTFHTKFYQFVNSISFNRPRDFLKLLLAMKGRLSRKEKITQKTIDTALMEYIDYFYNELVDELNFLNLLSIEMVINRSQMKKLFVELSGKEGFKFSELRVKINTFLNNSGASKSLSKNKTKFYIESLWRYGVLGYSTKSLEYISYYYMADKHDRPFLPIEDDVLYYLHRGLRRYNKKYKEE